MSNEITNTLAKKPVAGVRELIEGEAFKLQIAKVLPKILAPERFVRIAVTAMMKTPKLAKCSQASLLNALLQLAQHGLEPDGRRAHLIPYGDDVQLVIDYKGIAELVMRSGLVSYMHADVVCENDHFKFGLGEISAHEIDLRKPRGAVFAVYAICVFKDHTKKAEVMSRDEVEAVRKRSKSGSNGPWFTDWNEMAKKTVFRRLSKWLPLSPEIRDATENDDDVIDVSSAISSRTPISKVQALSAPINPFENLIEDAKPEEVIQ